jgi:hypothetical protein
VSLTVLVEHLDWWIGLFRALAPYAYNVWDEWRDCRRWAEQHALSDVPHPDVRSEP